MSGEKVQGNLAFPLSWYRIVGPWKPTLIFLPVVLALWSLALGLGAAWSQWGFWTGIGLLLWSLLEYLFHRFGHVMYQAGKRRGWDSWAYGIHWVHHDHPEDPNHLITRPFAVFVLSAIFFLLIWAVCPSLQAALNVQAGTMLGYLAYEWVHFRAHVGGLNSRPLLFLKQYHLRHHYSRHEALYGVTSPFWDWFFRSRIFH